MFKLGKLGIFFGGLAVGTAGIKMLTSKDAKKFYAHCAAAAIRSKDVVLDTVASAQANCDDILAEAHQINKDKCPEYYDVEEVEVEEAEEA